jgi:hypothetical protein
MQAVYTPLTPPAPSEPLTAVLFRWIELNALCVLIDSLDHDALGASEEHIKEITDRPPTSKRSPNFAASPPGRGLID